MYKKKLHVLCFFFYISVHYCMGLVLQNTLIQCSGGLPLYLSCVFSGMSFDHCMKMYIVNRHKIKMLTE